MKKEYQIYDNIFERKETKTKITCQNKIKSMSQAK